MSAAKSVTPGAPCIVGWGHTPFGKLDAADSEQLIRDAVEPALASAGLEASDIDYHPPVADENGGVG